MKDLKAQKLLQKIRARSASPPPVHYPTKSYISSYYVADNSALALHPKYLTMKALSGRSMGFEAPLSLQKANSIFEPLQVRTRSAYERERNCQPRLSYHTIDPTYHETYVPMYIRDPPCLRKSRIINRSSSHYNEQHMNKYNDDSSDDEDHFDLPFGDLHNKNRVHNHVVGTAMKVPDCIRRNGEYKHFFIHHPDTGGKLTLPKKYFKDDPVYKRGKSLTPHFSSGSTNIMNTRWSSGPSYSKEIDKSSAYGAFPTYESYVIREVPGKPPQMLPYSYTVAQKPKITA